MAKDISAFLLCKSTNCLAVGQALALVSRAVWWIGEAGTLTPFIHPGDWLVVVCGDANVGCHHHWIPIFRRVDGSLGEREGIWRESSDHRDDLNVSTVPEPFLGSTAHSLSPIVTSSPSVSCVVSPLHDALRASQSIWKLYLVVELCDLGRIKGHIELVGSWIFSQYQWVLVKTLLCSEMCFPIGRAQLQLKVAPVVRRDVNLDINGLSHGVSLRNNPISILSP